MNMLHEDAEKFLELNKVEKGIRNAAEAGAIIYAVTVDFTARNPVGGVSELFDSFGVVIFSTSRRRNLKLLTEMPASQTPLCVARYMGADNTLDVRPRNRLADDLAVVRYIDWAAVEALGCDPDLSGIVAEWNT
jgi:hypothetical protein